MPSRGNRQGKKRFGAMEYQQQLLSRLLEIERAIGVLDAVSLRRLVMEAEEYVLQYEKSSLQVLQLKLLRTRSYRN